MQQIVHIFKKDVRHLYREAAFLLAMAVIFAVVQTLDSRGVDVSWVLELLMAFAAAVTIARVVQAESIPGDCQFWITRPYRWQSLLAAKSLFVLAFVNLPVLLAQVFILRVYGFPIGSNWAGLFWCQVLMIFALEIPIATVAALTRGLIAFIACALVLGLIVVGLFAAQSEIARMPGPFDWLRYSAAFLAAAVLLPPLLYLQYRRRRTSVHRLWAVGAGVLALAAMVSIPWQLLFGLQARLSRLSFALQISQDSNAEIYLFSEEGKRICIALPVRVGSLPPEYEPEFEDFVLTLQGPDGRSMQLREGQLFTDYHSGEFLQIRGHAPVESSFLKAERGQPITLHAAFFVTIFGHSHGDSFAIPNTPTNVSDGMQCYADSIDDLVCRAAFRLPAESIDVKSDGKALTQQGWTPFTHAISYSPFPATLRMNPIKLSEPYFLTPGSSMATLVLKEPLAYLRRDFEIQGLHIAEH